jgi:hypothetical protein
MKKIIAIYSILFLFNHFLKADEPVVYSVKKVKIDLSQKPEVDAEYWKDIKTISVTLMGQMIVKPKPDKTESVKIQIIHDGKYIAFRMRWADKEKSEAGKLGEFSDAVALEFPVKDNANPPPIFMGFKDNPVHLFHWRAQYQYDEEHGKKTIKDIYPNLSYDIYPLDFADSGSIRNITDAKKEVFSPGIAAGNPQSYPKRAIDEIMAEGFGTSGVRKDHDSIAHGEWKDGEWTVIIARALNRPDGSVLEEGKGSSFGAAVWQGGLGEVASRKSLTMTWTPFILEVK